ncbi:hypothetical protein EsDP_00001325 [Epichloe bromicola]|uniref:Uncharacterized protein n=1 Tax=Epichloe bromicola TaxID=79588 RepID=A0ABQ0CHI7_9HYPO
MAQSQTAVLSRPTIPNASKRLSGYLPLSSTCPSLPQVQIATQSHTLSDCEQSCMKDGQSAKDWKSIVTPGPSTPSPTTKGKQAQPHQPMYPSVGELVPDADEDQKTPRASVMSSETLSLRRVDVQSTTCTGDEIVHETAGTESPGPVHQTETSIPGMYRSPCGIKTKKAQQPSHDMLDLSLYSAYQPSSSHISTRPPKEKHVEAVGANFETGPKKPRISNTIDHFESLISGDGSNGKHKSSIRLPKRLTTSSSCHLNKPDGKMRTGAAESSRRKFSSSWGPARFRKSRAPNSSGAAQPNNSDGPQRLEGDQLATDGTVEQSPPATENWPGRFQNNHDTYHVAQAQMAKTRTTMSSRLRPKGPRPQPVTTAENGSMSMPQSAEQVNTDADLHANDGHGSWRRRRRWVSRSSIPLVAQADCALQQPKPIRVNEVRRLVSLCRDKMTGRKYRAQTD